MRGCRVWTEGYTATISTRCIRKANHGARAHEKRQKAARAHRERNGKKTRERNAKARIGTSRKCRAQGTSNTDAPCVPRVGGGKVDFMRIAPTYAHPFISTGNGQFKAVHAKYPRGWNFGTNLAHWQTVVGDWNGDKRTDFMRIAATYAHAMMSRGNGQFTAHHTKYPRGWNFGTNLAHWQTVVGDWNGDGKTDFMRIAPTYAHAMMS